MNPSLDSKDSKHKKEEGSTNECTQQIVKVNKPKQGKEVMHVVLSVVVEVGLIPR